MKGVPWSSAGEFRGVPGTQYTTIARPLGAGFLPFWDATGALLQAFLEGLVAEHAAGPFVLAECLDLFFGGRAGQNAAPVVRKLKKRRYFYKAIILASDVGTSAAPAIVTRRGYQLGTNRVQLDVSRGRQQVRLVENKRRKTPLSEMAPPTFAEVEPSRIAPMGLAERLMSSLEELLPGTPQRFVAI